VSDVIPDSTNVTSVSVAVAAAAGALTDSTTIAPTNATTTVCGQPSVTRVNCVTRQSYDTWVVTLIG
jgi:hypothetical protein